MFKRPSIHLFPPHRRIRKSLFASPSVWCPSNFQSSTVDAIFSLYQQLQFAAFLNEWTINCLFSLTDATHSLTSTLLTNEFSVLGQSNARTQSITRGQSFFSLPCPTSVTELVQSLISLLAHFCGTLCRLLCRIPMLISLDLGTPLPLTWIHCN